MVYLIGFFFPLSTSFSQKRRHVFSLYLLCYVIYEWSQIRIIEQEGKCCCEQRQYTSIHCKNSGNLDTTCGKEHYTVKVGVTNGCDKLTKKDEKRMPLHHYLSCQQPSIMMGLIVIIIWVCKWWYLFVISCHNDF